MKKILLASGIFVGMMLITPLNIAKASIGEIEKEVIVKYSSEASKNIIRENADTVTEVYENLSMMVTKMPVERLQRLEEQGHIEFFEANKTIAVQHFAKTANASSAELEHWNIKALNIHNSWNNGYTGKGVKIAVIDSGVAQHADLAIAGGVSFVGNSYEDELGHGTHIAGIIGARHNGFGVAGIAPGAEVYAVKVMKKDGLGQVATILQAIDWSIEHKMDIINLSFGDFKFGPSLYQGIKKAADSGMLIVAASGNGGNADGTGDTVNYPAHFAEVIAVTSIDRQFKRSSFSGTGDANDFAAPGEGIYSTYLNGQYATYKGTSMAAPHITGLLALLKEQYPYASASELRDGLIYLGEDLGKTGYDPLYGHGLPKFRMPDGQMVTGLINSGFSTEGLQQKLKAMPNTIDKLAMKNEWKSLQQSIIRDIDRLIAEFTVDPTEQRYTELTKLLDKLPSAMEKIQKQKEIDTAIEIVLEPAVNAVTAYNKHKTNALYKKADAELRKLPALKAKQQLEITLNKGLQQTINEASNRWAQFEKKPTKENYSKAYLSIDSLPDSNTKSRYMGKLNSHIQTAVNQAAAKIGTYEKVQTLKNFNQAATSIQQVFDEKQRNLLEKRIQKAANHTLVNAKKKVAVYQKKKSRTNLNLAMKHVRELPIGKEKEQLLNKLK